MKLKQNSLKQDDELPSLNNLNLTLFLYGAGSHSDYLSVIYIFLLF